MSAPQADRQSPGPKNQSGTQQQDPMFSEYTAIDTRPAAELGQELSEGSSLQLPRNPVPHLEKIEAGKYEKSIRNFEEGSL
ncbi:uncharacterized protein N7506_005401 [Penicillium brevicompactum]|uniref:uncharacterized protein n=1 Tax=Penicillium brevicompactum TaxID=5074 RepID=UPI002541C15F|nr:uncharacterized protein N7506_005401 [Penicillium brevicompactum]KAJ5337379.1 hypothetical protein N7506_005401 [Penicillium brevicompactum]